MTGEKTALPSSSPSQLLSQSHLAQTSTYTHAGSCVTAPGQVLRASRAAGLHWVYRDTPQLPGLSPQQELITALCFLQLEKPLRPLPSHFHLGICLNLRAISKHKALGICENHEGLLVALMCPNLDRVHRELALSHTHSCNKTIFKQHLRTSLFWPRLTFNGRVPSCNFTISPSRESSYPGSKEWPWAYTKRAT